MDGDPSQKAVAAGIAAVLGIAGLAAIVVWTNVLGALAFLVVDEIGVAGRYLLGTLAVAPAGASVAALYLAGSGRDRSYLDLPRPTRRHAAYAAGGTAALVALNLAVDAVIRWSGIEFARHALETAAASNPTLPLVLVPLAYLSVGPGEELVYRNLVQKSLYDHFSRRGAIVVASLVFAAVHFPSFAGPGDSLAAIATSLVVVFVLSLVLGVVYERTDSLLVASFVHASFDAAAFLVIYAEVAGAA